MFAGMPGTGIGALFFALVCLSISVTRNIRQCGKIAVLSSVWIAGCVLLIYGNGTMIWLADAHRVASPSLIPLVLLSLVLGSAALVARLWLWRRPPRP